MAEDLSDAMQQGKIYVIMNEFNMYQEAKTEWFAIKTRQDFRAEAEFMSCCEEVLFPKEIVKIPGKKGRMKAVIPHVLFIKTTREKALDMEKAGREHPESSIPFWIYRYPHNNTIQAIPESSIHLFRLLTATDTTRCEIYCKNDFKESQHVRITDGPFRGYEGHVVRVKKNKHVVVKIEGICLVLLPFIHPDFLETVD